ncbi:MAG: hypothetical protein LBN97_06425 [Oscillospiraceae bacterium]|jgi:hypothetical protein|nr:hypothetical protein [Oscillospiraceae bacterium]
MQTITLDELVLLNEKLGSKTLTAILNGRTARTPEIAKKSLAERNVEKLADEVAKQLDGAADVRVTRYSAEPGSTVPYALMTVAGDKIAGIWQYRQITNGSRKETFFNIGTLPKAKFYDGLREFTGLISTADNKQFRMFHSTMNNKYFDLYITEFTNKGPALAIKRYKHYLHVNRTEMMMLNSMLFNVAENFNFTYEEAGKSKLCNVYRNGSFQIVSFLTEGKITKEVKHFYHYGLVELFKALRKAALETK